MMLSDKRTNRPTKRQTIFLHPIGRRKEPNKSEREKWASVTQLARNLAAVLAEQKVLLILTVTLLPA
jgi:hypothetical protein